MNLGLASQEPIRNFMPKVTLGATGASRHQGEMVAWVPGSLWGSWCQGIYVELLELTSEEVSRDHGSWESSRSPVMEAA